MTGPEGLREHAAEWETERSANDAIILSIAAERDDLRAEVQSLQAALAECLSPTPKPLVGWWAPDDEVQSLSVRLGGVLPKLTRTRGGEGEFDFNNSWFLPESRRWLAAGFLPGLQIQPKIGSGGTRTGYGVERILRGEADARIETGLTEWLDIPVGTKLPEEDVSEANIQKGQRAGQPFLAGWNGSVCTRPMTAAEYVELLRYLDAAKRTVGVRDRVHTIVSLTSGKWNSTSASDPWSGVNMTRLLQPLVDEGVVDLIAADAYYGGDYSTANTPEVVTRGVKRVASDLGIRWSVMETGAAAPVGAVNKAAWYRAWPGVIDENCYAVVVNISIEQSSAGLDFRPWVPDGALAGFADFMAALTEL